MKVVLMVFLLLSINNVQAQSVIDGDSFKYNGEEYRLACIDAPEWNQQGSTRAKSFLQKWLKKATRLEITHKGYYGRYVVYVWFGDTLINKLMYKKELVDFMSQYPCKYHYLFNH